MCRVIVLKMEQFHSEQLPLEPLTHRPFQALSSVALEQSVFSVGSECGWPTSVRGPSLLESVLSPIAAHALEKIHAGHHTEPLTGGHAAPRPLLSCSQLESS